MTTTDDDDGDYRRIDPGSLPPDLQRAIEDFTRGLNSRSPILDCLWGELYGAINANQWSGRITPETASYLRGKFLYGDTEDERWATTLWISAVARGTSSGPTAAPAATRST